MRTYFRSLTDVLSSPLALQARSFRHGRPAADRILKATRLEDMAYQDLRREDEELDHIEKACGERLSTFPALSREI